MSTAVSRELAALRGDVQELLKGQRELRAALDAVVKIQPRRSDPARDGRRLAAIARVFGGSIFSTVDLLAHPAAEVRAAFAGADGRQIGAWLKRQRNHATAGYVVRREGRDDHGTLWSLHVSALRHTGGRRPRDRGAE